MNDLGNNIHAIQVALFFKENTDVSILKMAREIQDGFSVMFPNEPQVMQLPIDAPPEIPRCIFQNENQTASIAFGNARLDFTGNFKKGTPWKSHIEIILYSLVRMCIKLDVVVKRIGIVIQTNTQENINLYMNRYVEIQSFKNAQEKNISWSEKRSIKSGMLINVFTGIVVNNSQSQNNVVLDVNTDQNSTLEQDEDYILSIANELMGIIEEKLKDVF